MNVLEQYVTNIISEQKHIIDGTTIYEIICDTNCYGRIEKNKRIILTELEYKMVKEKGYYLA